ncbi:hypothetical protein [Leptolyngbya sp. FACHB-17]|uniref:hypothetical protein n=1 Tax=unclassified Leptolyngbya TaxID=2650499 RepID=UPI0016817B24|nr:hypothetical protein [Leptolyngbya sp. FACHB-17]MBD2081395.1 hypothetical protein [Leptolyngbya sp. FACHB-17]
MSAQFSWTPEGKQFLNRLEELSRPQQVSFAELFTPGFIQSYTQFQSFELMLEASGFSVESAEDFLSIPEAEWNQFISQKTRFSNWQEMQKTAAAELMKKKLEL